MEALAELEGRTSARLRTEREGSPGVDRRELAFERRERDLRVYGQTHVNAAFTYTRPGGNRFNGPERGAWYCAYDVLTAAHEVGYHKTREFGYVGVYEEESRYVELLADFIGDFPDLRDEPDNPALDPDPAVGYPEGQKLALNLRRQGYKGLLYPSVRHPDGCRQPAASDTSLVLSWLSRLLEVNESPREAGRGLLGAVQCGCDGLVIVSLFPWCPAKAGYLPNTRTWPRTVPGNGAHPVTSRALGGCG